MANELEKKKKDLSSNKEGGRGVPDPTPPEDGGGGDSGSGGSYSWMEDLYDYLSGFTDYVSGFVDQYQGDSSDDGGSYYGGGYYGGGGGYSGPSSQQQQAADRTTEIAGYNAESITNQLEQQLAAYDQADRQNRALADEQRRQNSQKADTDRFQSQRDLIWATMGLLGNAGNTALQSSLVPALQQMLYSRNDSENTNNWNQLITAQNAVENAYTESQNQNNLLRNEAISAAEKALRDLSADLAAKLQNIHSDFYVSPGTGATDFGASGYYDTRKAQDNVPQMGGYMTPDYSSAFASSLKRAPRGNDYYTNLIRRPRFYNGR